MDQANKDKSYLFLETEDGVFERVRVPTWIMTGHELTKVDLEKITPEKIVEAFDSHTANLLIDYLYGGKDTCPKK